MATINHKEFKDHLVVFSKIIFANGMALLLKNQAVHTSKKIIGTNKISRNLWLTSIYISLFALKRQLYCSKSNARPQSKVMWLWRVGRELPRLVSTAEEPNGHMKNLWVLYHYHMMVRDYYLHTLKNFGYVFEKWLTQSKNLSFIWAVSYQKKQNSSNYNIFIGTCAEYTVDYYTFYIIKQYNNHHSGTKVHTPKAKHLYAQKFQLKARKSQNIFGGFRTTILNHTIYDSHRIFPNEKQSTI